MLHRESDTQDDETAADRASERESHVGALLRETRLSFGLSVEDVAAHLRIRRDFIAAIEERRVEGVPAPAYLLGFLRSYATFLGLDPDEVVRRFRNDVSGINRRPKFRPPEPVPERGIPAGAMMVVGLVLAAGAYGGWYWYSGGADRPQAVVPPVPERLAVAPAPLVPGAPTAPRPAALPASGAPSLVAPGAGPSAGQPGAPAGAPAMATPGTGPLAAAGGVALPAPFSFDAAAVPTVRPPAAAAALPPPNPAAGGTLPGAPNGTFNGRPLPGFVGPGAAPWTPAPGAADGAQPGPVGAAPATTGPELPLPPRLGAGNQAALVAEATPAATTAAGTGEGRFLLLARVDSWVSLRDGSGASVFNRVLRAGETYRVPARPGMVLTTGNAGGLEIQLDGQAMPALGGVGQVRRDLPLEPERLRSLLSAGR